MKQWIIAAFAALLVGAPAARAADALDGEISAAAATVDASDPAKLISSVASAMLRVLDAHRAEFRKDPAKVYVLLDRILLPHFDSQFAAGRVLGLHRKEATPEQLQRFIDVFYRFLLKTYADRLVDFTSDRMVVNPYRGKADATYATVSSKVRKDDGSQVAVDYLVRRSPDGSWKAWNVIIEGVDSVVSFQQDFDSEISARGLDALIARLQAQGSPTGSAAAGGG